MRRTTEGDIAILPKGARVNGYLYLCDPSRVLDYESGYNRAGILAERVAAVRAALPVVQTLTIERLAQLPRIESQPDECTLALFGTWRSPFRPTETWCWGALWLLYGYDPEDDLAAGVLFLRPQCGLSEHRRSITRIARQRHCYAYGRHLLRFGGGIVAARAVPVRDALAWTNVADHDTVLAYVSRRSSKKPCSTTTHVSMRQDRCSDDL